MPRVSVILTSYNHAKYLNEAIDSVLCQSFSDFEMFIIDDCSSDESWAIIKNYSDPRIIAQRSITRCEVAYRMADVISNQARGDYIAIHHSDDVWQPGKLDAQVTHLDAHDGVGAVFTNVLAIDEDGSPLQDHDHFYFSIFDQPNRTRHQWLRRFFYEGNALCHPSALIRRQCFSECGLYKQWLFQLDDFDMWIRLLMKYEIHVIPEQLIRFRVRSNEANVSGNTPTNRVRTRYEYLKILENYRAIGNFVDLCAVFPEARKYGRGPSTDKEFALGLVALQTSTQPFVQLFGLNLVQEAMADSRRAAAIKATYGFDFLDFVKLTGENDVFSVEASSNLQQKYMEIENLARDEISRREAAEAQADQLRADLTHQSAAAQAAQAQADQLRADLTHQSAAAQAAQAQADQLRADLTRQSAAAQAAQAQAERIEQSTMWRATKPLRIVLDHMPRGLRRMLRRIAKALC